MFSQLKLILFFMLLSGAAGGLWYVQNLKAENEILTLNNAKLNEAVESQQAVIEQQLRDIEAKTDINKIYFPILGFSLSLSFSGESFFGGFLSR